MSHIRPGHAPRKLRHRSIDYRRTRSGYREHAFATEWERENLPTSRRGISSFGTLQALMFDQRNASIGASRWWHLKCRFWITNKEAAIAATVVQWLGTNVGMDFLRRCLKACGYKIVRDEEWQASPDCCGYCSGRGRRARIGGQLVCGWCRMPWHAKEAACL